MTVKRKVIDFEVKDPDKGLIAAVFATHNVVDKDGDVTLAGAHGVQKVALLKSHNWGDIGIGRGTTHEDGDKSIFEGGFNLNIDAGRETFEQVKFQGDLLEYSYGYFVLPGGSKRGEFQGQDVNFLTPKDDGTPGMRITEVSPVLVGAGEDTGTIAVKSTEMVTAMAEELNISAAKIAEFAHRFGLPWQAPTLPIDTGKTFAEDGAAVMTAASSFVNRAAEIRRLRSDQGKELSEDTHTWLRSVDSQMAELRDLLKSLVEAPTLPPTLNADQLKAQTALAGFTV